MIHTFEFIAELTDGRTCRMMYKGKSSRHLKVKHKILQDLKTAYNIDPLTIKELYIKPVKPQNNVNKIRG